MPDKLNFLSNFNKTVHTYCLLECLRIVLTATVRTCQTNSYFRMTFMYDVIRWCHMVTRHVSCRKDRRVHVPSSLG